MGTHLTVSVTDLVSRAGSRPDHDPAQGYAADLTTQTSRAGRAAQLRTLTSTCFVPLLEILTPASRTA